MSLCRYCLWPVGRAPARACLACREVLHVACWAQLERRGVRGCGHEIYVAGVAFVGSDLVVSVDGAGAARSLRVSTGDEAPIKGPGEPVRRVLGAAEGAHALLVGDTRASARAGSDLGAGKVIEGFPGAIEQAAIARGGSVAALTFGAQAKIVDLASGTARPLGRPFPDRIARVALSPDGRLIAALLADGRLLVRDAELGVEVAVTDDVSGSGDPPPPGSIGALGFSPDGALLSLDDGTSVFVLDALTARPLRHERLASFASAVSVGPAGRLTFVAGGASHEVLLGTSDPDASPAQRPPRAFRGLWMHVTSASILDERRAAVGGADGAVMVIDASSDQPLALLRGHRNSFRVADDERARRLFSLPGPHPAAPAAFERQIALLPSSGGAAVELRSGDTGRLERALSLGERPAAIQRVDLPSGPALLLRHTDGLSLVDLEAGERWRARSDRYSERARAVVALPPASPPGSAGEGSPLVVTCSSWTGFVEAFEAATGEGAWVIERGDGASLQGDCLLGEEGGSVLWFIKGGDLPQASALLVRVDARGRASDAGRLASPLPWSPDLCALTPDGAHAVIGHVSTSDDRRTQLALFSLDDRSFVGPVAAGHLAPLRAAAVSPVGHLLATAGDDRSVRLWDLRSARPVLTFVVRQGSPCSLAFSPDGATLYAGSEGGPLEAWDLTGLDTRTDVLSSLMRARAGLDSSPREAEARLARRPLEPEALAGLLLFRRLDPAGSGLPLPDGIDPSAFPQLASDFDRRVRAALRVTARS